MNYTVGGKKKNKALRNVIIVVAVIAAGLYVIGLTLGSSSESRVAISEAIAENTRLKEELREKDARINELSERIAEFEKNAPIQIDDEDDKEEVAEETSSASQASPRE